MEVTQSPVKLIAPLATGDGRTYRYGNGFPFQAGPNTAGVFLNLRFEGFPAGDFEAGMDVVLFDDLESISSKDASIKADSCCQSSLAMALSSNAVAFAAIADLQSL